jgi:hypothetical protein
MLVSDIDRATTHLNSLLLIIILVLPGLRVIVILIVALIQRASWQSTTLNSSPQCLSAHFTPRLRLGVNQSVSTCTILLFQSNSTTTLSASQCQTICRSASSGICAGDESDNCADEDGGLSGSGRADERVAVLVIGFHGDSGEGEVGAVNRNGGSLGKTGTWVGRLNCWVDGKDGDRQ